MGRTEEKKSKYYSNQGGLEYFFRHQLDPSVLMSQQPILWSSTPLPQQPGNSVRTFLRASSRRGGLAGRGSFNSSTLMRRVTGEEEEERVEQSGDEEEEGSDTSVDSDVGSLLGRCLEIE